MYYRHKCTESRCRTGQEWSEKKSDSEGNDVEKWENVGRTEDSGKQ